MFQPLAADDAAQTLAGIAMGAPTIGSSDLAGPEQFQLDEAIREYLNAIQDPRQVITDNQILFFGAKLDSQSLVPGEDAQISSTRFADFLKDLKIK